MVDIDGQTRKRRDIKGEARRGRILQLLRTRASGDFTVEELSECLGVSLATVRRDLGRMREHGVVARTYGGVTLMPTVEVPVRDRRTSNRAAKDAIGSLAAHMINPGDLVIIDAGTTTARLAANIADIAGITVVTNGIGVINAVLDNPGADVIVLGGELRSINETITGASAEETLTHIRANCAFIGTDAISPDRGIASRTLAQSRLKTQMMRSASEVVVLADSSKLNGGDFTFWSPLTGPWVLITDSGADPEALQRASRAGAVDIRIADIDGSAELEQEG